MPADDLAVGLAVGLALAVALPLVVGVGVAVALTGGWDAETVMPNAAAGAQLYAQALPFCSDLYLTLVKRVVDGDTFFPPFEEQFVLAEEILDRPEFKILHYRNKAPSTNLQAP